VNTRALSELVYGIAHGAGEAMRPDSLTDNDVACIGQIEQAITAESWLNATPPAGRDECAFLLYASQSKMNWPGMTHRDEWNRFTPEAKQRFFDQVDLVIGACFRPSDTEGRAA
jgi:hypothetical protein